jgi:hypothetical protein
MSENCLKSGEKADGSPLAISLSSCGGNEADYWEAHLETWSQSGLTQAEYCRRHNLNYNKFCRWKERFNHYYPPRSSVKLVEVKRDFRLNANAVRGPNGFNSAGPGLSGSGIRFWCGEFCIEVGVQFCSSSLSQLIETLQELGLERLKTKGCADSVGSVGRVGSVGSE